MYVPLIVRNMSPTVRWFCLILPARSFSSVCFLLLVLSLSYVRVFSLGVSFCLCDMFFLSFSPVPVFVVAQGDRAGGALHGVRLPVVERREGPGKPAEGQPG